jgi:vacuolar iron transporter family protein
MTKLNQSYFRSIIFGLEDALVSTTGVVAGVAAGSNSTKVVLLAGLVAVAVEALSMGAGQYLSEQSVHQLDRKLHQDNLALGAFIMFVSYLLGGLVPILPVIFFPDYIIPASLGAALAALYLVGWLKGRYVNVSPSRSALEMALVGGGAALVGIIVGSFVSL